MYVLYPYKGIPGFSVLCVLVLLPLGPWCHLRSSAQWNQTDGMRADCPVTFLDHWIAYQIWGCSLHTCLTWVWVHNNSPSSVITNGFTSTNVSMLQHQLEMPLEHTLNKSLVFASVLGSVDAFESRALARMFTYAITVAWKDGERAWQLLITYLSPSQITTFFLNAAAFLFSGFTRNSQTLERSQISKCPSTSWMNK